MLQDFIDYFRQLAVKNKDLKHDPAAEKNDAKPGTAHFATQTYMETLTGSNSRIGYPILLVNIPAADFKGEPYNIDKNSQSALTVLARAGDKSEAAKNIALAKAEKIMYDILSKIYRDHYGKDAERCGTPLEYFQFDGLTLDNVGPLQDNCYGWVVEFHFKQHSQFNIAKYDATAWDE
jgi:hypothetical protein